MNAGLPTIWEERFTVRAGEAGESGCAGAAAVWRYLQEAAGVHASRLGLGVEDLLRINRTWVLSRLRLRLFRQPAWQETVTVATWPAGVRSLFACRGFALRDGKDQPLAHAESDWIFLDLAARRPVRPPEWLAAAAPNPIPPLYMPDVGRLADPPPPAWSLAFPVRRSEIDLNRHVTNSAYVDWALETVPDAFCRGNYAADVEVVYRASAVRGDVVRSEAAPADNGTVLHRLVREADGAVLAQARSVWEPVKAST